MGRRPYRFIAALPAIFDDDNALVNDLLAWMKQRSADFTNTFRWLTSGAGLESASLHADEQFQAWGGGWQTRRAREPHAAADAEALMRRHNPAFIPRNHNVEAALDAASDGEFSAMERLMEVLASPFDYERDLPMFSEPGPAGRPYRTFCGT